MNILIDGCSFSLDLSNSQKYKNMEVIPVRINSNGNKEYLTLKRGMRSGLVEIGECEVSTVGTVLASNNANIPLVLIDGDEIVGAMQNRIMNRSLIIPPKTTMHVSVSCTEQGRWHYGRNRRPYSSSRGNDWEETIIPNTCENYGNQDNHDVGYDEEIKENFDFSDFAADFSTRRAKSNDLFEQKDCQSTVWDSISKLEDRTSFKSTTSALHDNYENHRSIQDEFLKHFKIEFAQSGAIFVINGQIKGFELFANPSIYHDYHEKIFRTYIMEAIASNRKWNSSDISFNELQAFLSEISNAEYRYSQNKGIGRHMNFANKYGTGSVLIDGGNLVHINYFNSLNPKVNRSQSRRYGTFRDFVNDS